MKFCPPEEATKFLSQIFCVEWVAKYFKQPAETSAAEYVRLRDEALIALCADKLQERGHAHAANSLRKMAREGEIP